MKMETKQGNDIKFYVSFLICEIKVKHRRLIETQNESIVSKSEILIKM